MQHQGQHEEWFKSFPPNPPQCDTQTWWASAKCLLSYDVYFQLVKTILYDYYNDLMPLVIFIVIKYIKRDDDLEEKEAQETS